MPDRVHVGHVEGCGREEHVQKYGAVKRDDEFAEP